MSKSTDARRKALMDEMDKVPRLVFDVVEVRPRDPRCSVCGGKAIRRSTDGRVVWYKCESCGANIKSVRTYAGRSQL